MHTAGDVAQKALKAILVQATDAPLEPDEYADFLDAMNDYMAALEAEGLRLGYTPVTNVSDEVTVPDGAISGLIANLAIEVSADYGGMISASLVQRATRGMRVMRLLGQRRISSSYPGTLPLGAGNRGSGYYYESPFYHQAPAGLLTLSGNARVTLISTADTPVIVGGFWKVARLRTLDGDITGRFIAIKTWDAQIKSTLTATGNGSYVFHIMKNGVSIATTPATLTATPASVTLNHNVKLLPGDQIEIYVECVAATENCTVTDASLEIC